MNRKIVLSILVIALLGVTGLCALTGFGLYSWGQRNRIGVNLFRFENFSAQVTETKTYPASRSTSLEINTDSGDITITSGDVDQIQVEMVKEGWGISQAEAEATAAALQVEVRQTGSQLKLTFRQPEQFIIAGSVHSRRVDFNVVVPPATAVNLFSSNGAISLDGLQADAELHTNFGEISVTDHTGSLLADGGSLVIENVEAGSAGIRLVTTFGDIQANHLAGASLTVENTNGEMNLQNMTISGTVSLKNDFGPVLLSDFLASDLTITSQNGDVRLDSGSLTGRLSAASSYGDVIVTGVDTGDTVLETDNGKLELDGARGRLKLTNEYGDILIRNAVDVAFQMITTNGKVEFWGSIGESGEHSIENSYGDVILHLPGESAFNFNLSTEYGQITSELPLTLSGEMSENQWQGEVNGGGPLLRVSTDNGNIKLLAQAAQ